jgi:3-phosphoshikimate 1-carboxyvinyltransferase
MSRYLIQPSRLEHGDIVVPGDKSISHRALMLGAIAEGCYAHRRVSRGEDCLATMQAVRSSASTSQVRPAAT